MIFRNVIFGKGKYFQVCCIMKIVLENIFMCLVIFWKCYFPTNFSHFLSIQTNFITKNFNPKSQIQPNTNPQNKSQPNTHHLQPPTTNHNHQNLYPPPKQHHTPPKLQFNPRQQTSAIKSHNRRQKKQNAPKKKKKKKKKPEKKFIKGEIEGEIERRGAAIDETGAIWCVRSSDWSSRFVGEVEGVIWALSSSSCSLSLSHTPETIWSENRNWKWFPGSKLIFYSQMKIISGKFYFQSQPNSLFYGKWFPKTIWSQNKRSLNHDFSANYDLCVCCML